jgi:hypothetical protein
MHANSSQLVRTLVLIAIRPKLELFPLRPPFFNRILTCL